MTFCLSPWPCPSFSDKSNGTSALFLCNSIIYFGCITKVQTIANYALQGRKKCLGQCGNGVFLCKTPLNIMQPVLKMKQQVYNNRVITLVQRFIFVRINNCSLTQNFIRITAAVGPYKSKSWNSSDNHSLLFKSIFLHFQVYIKHIHALVLSCLGI